MPRSTGKQELVYIEPSSVKALQRLARELKERGDGKEVKKRLNRAIKDATAPLERDIKDNARGLTFTGRGSGDRARRTATVTKTGRQRKGIGLRDAMVKGIKTEISYRAGAGAGVRIRLKSSDADVNRIGRAINRRGKVRHPVFGDRENWADTIATNGKDWFYGPVPKHRDDVTREVKRAIDAELNKLARDIG